SARESCRSSVLQDLLALDDDVTRALDRDGLARDLDVPVLLHDDARAAGFDRDLVSRLDHELLFDLQSVVRSDLRRPILPDLVRVTSTDLLSLVFPHLDV